MSFICIQYSIKLNCKLKIHRINEVFGIACESLLEFSNCLFRNINGKF